MSATLLASVIVLSMTFAVTSFSAILLFKNKTVRSDQALFLGVFLGLYALTKLNEVLTLIGAYAAFPILAAITTPVRFLFGAVIYFYTRAITSPKEQYLQKKDFIALVWPSMAILVVVPFVLMSPEDKNSILTSQISSVEVQNYFNLACKMIYGIFLLSVFTYLVASFRLVIAHTKNIRNFFSNLEDKSLTWLRVILVVLAIGWSWNAIEGLWAIFGDRPNWIPATTALFELIWISVISYCGLNQAIIYPETSSNFNETTKNSSKYSRSALDKKRMVRIAEKLERAMTEERCYQSANLSLRTLASHISVPEHYVSQTLNDELGESFFDFVNRHRTRFAHCALLESSTSINEIAESVGYKSRSTFNTAFKKNFGMTPSMVRKQRLNQRAPQ